jgi:hypothetical protein
MKLEITLAPCIKQLGGGPESELQFEPAITVNVYEAARPPRNTMPKSVESTTDLFPAEDEIELTLKARQSGVLLEQTRVLALVNEMHETLCEALKEDGHFNGNHTKYDAQIDALNQLQKLILGTEK